jgi:site-specific DNA-methyltransferase (adenine-specific)
VELFQNGGKAWVKRSELEANVEWVDRWKVLIPRGTDGNEIYPLPVLTEPIVAGPGTACTETYLVVGPVKSKTEAERVAAYMKTRFFRFLLSLRKPTQDNSREKFSFIPRLAFDRIWTDEELYAKYGITKAEQAYIASMIKGMPS